MQEKNIKSLAENLMLDYQKNRDIDVIDALITPDKEEVIKILEDVRSVIFPVRLKIENNDSQSVLECVKVVLEDLQTRLKKQISIALKYLTENKELGEKEIYLKSKNITLNFLERLKDIRELIQTDLQAAFDGDPAAFNKQEIMLSYPGFFAITVSRIAHELYTLGVPLVPRIMTEYAHAQTGIDIHPGAKIGKYFFIDHGTGTVIGETSVIGDNVKIYQGVTIGALSTRGGQKLSGKKRHPTIENNVTIYTGASILGGDTVIGHNSVIGGNAFITSSVPSNTKVSIKCRDHDYKN